MMKINLDWDTLEALEKIGLTSYDSEDLETIIKRLAQVIFVMGEDLSKLMDEHEAKN